jgi:hypothetical protein
MKIVFFFPVHPIGREHRAAASSLSELSAPGHAAPDFRPLWNQLHLRLCSSRPKNRGGDKQKFQEFLTVIHVMANSLRLIATEERGQPRLDELEAS